jgi:diacylglycerol kinase
MKKYILLPDFVKCIKSFRYAAKGVQFMLMENNFKIHLLAMMIVLIFSWWLELNTIEWILVLLMIGMVMVTETINTVFEKYLDFYHPEYDKRTAVIKDLAAGAVLIVSVIVAISGLILFLPKLLVKF